MENESSRPEKVKFRRDEITDLASFPSAVVDPVPVRAGKGRRVGIIAYWTLAGLLALILVSVGVLHTVGIPGVGSERLRLVAEAQLRQVAGVQVDASMGKPYITLDGLRFLALEVPDVTLRRASDGAEVATAGTVRFGVRLLPLLVGEVRLASASLSDARIFPAVLSSGAKSDWTSGLRNANGLLDPDLVAKALFETTHLALDRISARALQSIELGNVDIVLPAGDDVTSIRVASAKLTETARGSLALSAQFMAFGRGASVELIAARNRVTRRVSALELAASVSEAEREARGGAHIGAIQLKLSGKEGDPGAIPRIDANIKVSDGSFDLGRRGGILSGDLDLSAFFIAGSDRVEIDRLHAQAGRSTFDFRGRFGPRPPEDGANGEPAYRFNLVSARSTIAPEGSPEPAINLALQLAGIYQPEHNTLSLSDIIAKSTRGEALGTAVLQLESGKTPGMSVAFSVHDMPVSQVKQLWPWFSAHGARDWVLSNVFGGRVSDGRLQVNTVPGQLGNGIPLSGDESFGTFRIEGTRFDTAGLIPPVRDADGTVDYRGTDVDVTLEAGTVFLPSGRTVAASNGTLSVKQANVKPVIGRLDIDVAGDAPAVAELASYDPINAMRFVELTPDQFTSGHMEGKVQADIPLHKGIDRDRLNWLVALDYEDLSISKPFSGQLVSEAHGRIEIEKTKAVISANARLNGIPAEIDAVEPLGGSDAQRTRTVTLTLDDKARAEMVPGLADLVKGPVKVVVDPQENGRQIINADLTQARLDIPWVGWSKGPGIAGSVSFVLENADGRSSLSDFELRGASFGVTGALTLSDGGLSEAKFSNVRLNRNDDVAVTIRRAGKGYAVDVRGKSLDARAVVKRFTDDARVAGKAASNSEPVTVKLQVDSVAGFHGERLGNFRLDYGGAGSRIDRLAVTAATSSGGSVVLNSNTSGSGRTMGLTSADAGALLRFLDIYERMEGGTIDLALEGGPTGPMSGRADARDFVLVNEPRLSSIVSTAPPGDDRSLNQAVRRDIDTSRVNFERCYSRIEKGDGYLRLSRGVLRGPLVGASFQGTLYDPQGKMEMTGTFMPAYGLNRLFGEIPIIGALLGNGRDRGLIGVTFKLEGDADSPGLQINPLSVIAPGIFRSIFEFR